MKNKKLIAGVTALALASNLGLALMAGAETGSVQVTGGTLSIAIADNTLVFTDKTDNTTCSGTAMDTEAFIDTACTLSTITVTDPESSTEDVVVQLGFNQDFTSGSDTIALSGLDYGADYENDDGSDYAAGGDTVTITNDDVLAFSPNTSQTIITFTKSNAVANFEYAGEFRLDLSVPAFVDSGTYTNTATFTVSHQ